MNTPKRRRSRSPKNQTYARRLALAFAVLAQVEKKLDVAAPFFEAEYAAHLDGLAAREPIAGDEERCPDRWEVAS